MESIVLIGSEEVRTAGYAMQNAAESLRGTVRQLDAVLLVHRQQTEEFLTGWLDRLEKVLSDARR